MRRLEVVTGSLLCGRSRGVLTIRTACPARRRPTGRIRSARVGQIRQCPRRPQKAPRLVRTDTFELVIPGKAAVVAVDSQRGTSAPRGSAAGRHEGQLVGAIES